MTASHFLYLREGKFDHDCTRATVTSFVDEALQASAAGGLVLYFHGGLNDEQAGLKSATTLLPIYQEQGGAWPIFHIWHSGLVDTLRAQLTSIGNEQLFQELVKKATEWVLKKFPSTGTKGLGSQLDVTRLRAEYDAYFAQPIDSTMVPPPTALHVAAAGVVTKGATPPPNEDLLSAEISMSPEPRLLQALTGVANDRFPTAAGGKGGGMAAKATPSLLSAQASHQLFGSTYSTKGVIEWVNVARFIARIVIQVLRRHHEGRDHGTFPTIVEEVLRAAYLANIGTDVWNTMKGFTASTFGPDAAQYGGTALLEELAARYAAGEAFPKITLIGHSTGSNYICNLLAHGATTLPNVKFEVILLAPVVTYDVFADTLQKYGTHIAGIRVFGMSDDIESADRLVGIFYPRSLLYFVSGLLEDDSMGDKPILGMQRYVTEGTYGTGFPTVDACKQYLNDAHPARLVWSDSAVGPGLNCTAHHHGDFDDGDQPCIQSVAHILQTGW